jgi:SNF2 family DNA or RNA helicase
VRDRVLEVDGEVISAIQAQSLRQKAARMVLCPEQFTDKTIKENAVRDSLTELLDELGAAHQEKVLIFGIYNKSIEAMGEWFRELNPALVYGKSDSKKNVKKFLHDDTCRLMIAHYKSGGVGLNLQDVCRYVVCVEPTSVPGDFLQAVERVYRKGQKRHVTFYIFRVKGTVWPKMVDNMRGKMKITMNVQMDQSAMLSELLGED